MEREKTEHILINHQWGNQSYRENLIKELRNRQWEDQWLQVIWRAEQCQNRKLPGQNTQIRKPGLTSQSQFKKETDLLQDLHKQETDLLKDLHKPEIDLLKDRLKPETDLHTDRREIDRHKPVTDLHTDLQETDLHKPVTDRLTDHQETDLHKPATDLLTDLQETDLHRIETDLHKPATDLLTDLQVTDHLTGRIATDLRIEETIINLKLKHRLLRNRLVLISVLIKKKKEISLQSWKKERQKNQIS